MGGIVGQSSSNLANRSVDAPVYIHKYVAAPELARNFYARNELVLSLDQKDQQFHWLPFQPYATTLEPEFIAGEIELKFAGLGVGGHNAGLQV